jgi:hypothetical protein
VATIVVAFASPKVINGSFSTIDHKQTFRISGLGKGSMHGFLSVFPNRTSPMVLLTRRRSAVLFPMFSKEYVSYIQFANDSNGTLHRNIDHLLYAAAGVKQN